MEEGLKEVELGVRNRKEMGLFLLTEGPGVVGVKQVTILQGVWVKLQVKLLVLRGVMWWWEEVIILLQ